MWLLVELIEVTREISRDFLNDSYFDAVCLAFQPDVTSVPSCGIHPRIGGRCQRISGNGNP